MTCDGCAYSADGLCLIGRTMLSRCAYYRPQCSMCSRPMTDYGQGFVCEPCQTTVHKEDNMKTNYIGKIVITHAPKGAYPPADMIEQMIAGKHAYIAWIEDHGWKGWQVVEVLQYCADCGDQLVGKGGNPRHGTSALTRYNYSCPTCGQAYF